MYKGVSLSGFNRHRKGGTKGHLLFFFFFFFFIYSFTTQSTYKHRITKKYKLDLQS